MFFKMWNNVYHEYNSIRYIAITNDEYIATLLLCL